MLFCNWFTFAGWSFLSLQKHWWWAAVPHPTTQLLEYHVIWLENLFKLSNNFDAPLLHEAARTFWNVLESSPYFFMFIAGETLRSTGAQKERDYSTVQKTGAYLHLQINSKIVISGTKRNKFWFWCINLHKRSVCQYWIWTHCTKKWFYLSHMTKSSSVRVGTVCWGLIWK